MRLDEVYQPITNELNQVRAELKKIESEMSLSSAKEVFEHFFRKSGKLLRPALVLLSAGTANPDGLIAENSRLIRLAASLELVHNASLIHDDIIDEDMFRRGYPTLNNVFGNKTAALAGDALFSRAFSILAELLPHESLVMVAKVVKAMSLTEIRQLTPDTRAEDQEGYFDLIKKKTALLMSICCRLGAGMVSQDVKQLDRLEEFGLNFGMMYQVVDDFIDEDPQAAKYSRKSYARELAKAASDSLAGFEDSVCTHKLYEFIDFVMGNTHYANERKIVKKV